MAEIIGGNGQPAPLTPPDDAISLTLRYWWTPQGTMLAIESNPTMLYGDTIIEILLRAARHYERQLTAGGVASTMAQASQVKRLVTGLPRGHG